MLVGGRLVRRTLDVLPTYIRHFVFRTYNISSDHVGTFNTHLQERLILLVPAYGLIDFHVHSFSTTSA
jgi:hypothetical protein